MTRLEVKRWRKTVIEDDGQFTVMSAAWNGFVKPGPRCVQGRSRGTRALGKAKTAGEWVCRVPQFGFLVQG
jgi:hypothetical protein